MKEQQEIQSKKEPFDLYLASKSPRRKELLLAMGLSIRCVPADLDEEIQKHETPENYVQRLALEKAKSAFCKSPDRIQGVPFLGADTIVVCENEIFGKPQDKIDAFQMWNKMSGTQHTVLTAVSVIGENVSSNDKAEQPFTIHSALSSNRVNFKKISLEEMENYWRTGEPQDKAGGYGIQGKASAWVVSIEGSYSGIMGLPLFETNQCLMSFGLHWL